MNILLALFLMAVIGMAVSYGISRYREYTVKRDFHNMLERSRKLAWWMTTKGRNDGD